MRGEKKNRLSLKETLRSILRDIKLKNLSSSDLTITTLIYSYLFFLLRRRRVSERTKKNDHFTSNLYIYSFVTFHNQIFKFYILITSPSFFYICSVIKCGRYKMNFVSLIN